MKRFFNILMTSLAVVAVAQAQEQTGVPAKMEISTGKVVPVYLQSLDDGKLIFQIYKRPKNIPLADISKVVRFDFLNQFDSEGALQLFNAGEYQGLVDKMATELKPSLEEYLPFMAVDNNLQTEFCNLLEAYLELEDFAHAEIAASALMQSSNPDVRTKGQSAGIHVALKKGNIEEAEGLLEGVDSDVGKLYLKACIARAKDEHKEAFLLVNEIISGHANDLQWMPQSELLNVYLYRDIGLTNSAILTARQVSNIYANSHTAATAQKLKTEMEAAVAAAEAAAKIRDEEEEKARAEVRARAEARAGITADSTEESDVQPGTDDGEPEDAVEGAEPETDAGSDVVGDDG